MERLVSLISGGGSTMEQIGLAIERGGIPDMQLAGVISSKADAGGVQKARALGIEPIVVDPREFRSQALGGKIDREAFGHRLLRVLREDLGATVVTQNGWIPHTPPRVTEAYAGRIFNQHPGEPGMFGGKGMAGKAVHVAVLKFQELVGRVFPTAVVADYLTTRGMPFRRAHEVVGAMVRRLVTEGRDFSDLTMEEWREASEMFGDDAPLAATALASVKARRTPQSTNPDAVSAALTECRAWIGKVC